MGPTLTSYGRPFPRRQAQRLVELLSRPESALQAVLTARRREGKSDLLVQIQAALFDKADGPMPFRYVFDPRRAPDALARHFAASFCQQMRAFVMRQPEMLGEPLALLERELERPGLPLALTELGREYLALSSSARLEFAATLPGQFAYQEGRPLCLLLDNAETLEVFPELLSTLDDPRLSWLLTGRCRPLRRLAGRRGWPLLPLEPFALEEAMALASERCRQFEMPWVASAWQDWFAIAGTSPEWVDRLIESAAAAGRRLDSLEDLGRAYVRELAGGGMGQLFQERWQTVFADRGVAAEASLAGVREASHVAARLLQPQGGMLEPEAVPPGVRDGLAAEEWIVETPLGDAVRLSTVERDWLELARNTARFGAERAEAGLLQAFLARAEGARQWRQAGDAVHEIRTGLLALPGLTAGEARSPRLPELCSVAVERTATAELYWCYGFRAGWPRERRDRPEAACLYLIALCRWEPADSEVKQWNRRLQEEARSLPVQAAMEGAASAGLGPRYELWLALPRGASMAAVAGELRMWWEELAGLLGGKSLPLAEAASAPALAERRPNQSRLEELETRAHWLEEELAMAREQFRRETRKNLLAARPSPAGEAPPAAAGEAAADSARLALLLHMLQVVTELLGSHARNQPAASESLQEIRRWADQMAELLRLPPDAAALSRPESTRDDPGAAPGKP